MAEPRFTVQMYEGIEKDSREEVVLTVDHFVKGLPGFRRETTHEPHEAQQTIDDIWRKLITAMDKYGISYPPEARSAAERLKAAKT